MEIIDIYGAGGHGHVVKEAIEASPDKCFGIFFDDNRKGNLVTVEKWGVSETGHAMIIAIGDNTTRKIKAVELGEDVPFAVVVHPSAVVSVTSKIGVGSVVMAAAVVQARTYIGRHVIINSGAIVDHDCVISDFVHISPGATLCGCVEIGEESWIGAGSTILPGVKVGKRCVIGAGSVVLHDIPDEVVAFGNPAKIKSAGE